MIRKILNWKTAVSSVAALALAVSLPISSLAAPAFTAPVSADNAVAIASEYDPDGYYILQDGIAHGDDISFWLHGGSSNAEALDTAVHEETHSYTWNNGNFSWTGMSEAIYMGSGNKILVPQTDVVPTETWSASLPSSLQTFRYDTYVSPGASASANQDAVYGLLNEFSAYSWGMHTELNLLDYYKTGPKTIDVWEGFINSCENDYTAFCEFRFWTLGYLAYVQSAYPQVWQGIMSNQDYINAYCATERRFENQIAIYKARRGESGMYFIGDRVSSNPKGYGTGFMLMSSSQKMLLDQINQPQLQAQEQYMFSKCSIEVLPAADVNP